MRIKPRVLATLIIFSFILLVFTIGGASEPNTVLGIVFWLSFGVFAFCCVHLSKNDEYYKQFLEDE